MDRKWSVFATFGFVLAVCGAVGVGQQGTATKAGTAATPSQAPGQQPPGGERVPGPSIQFQVPPMPVLPNNGLGETDQPFIPGQPWRIRDLNRPKPVTVTPGRHAGDPPSDAIVLFDGTGLSHWTVGGPGRGGAAAPPAAAPAPTTWKVENGA